MFSSLSVVAFEMYANWEETKHHFSILVRENSLNLYFFILCTHFCLLFLRVSFSWIHQSHKDRKWEIGCLWIENVFPFFYFEMWLLSFSYFCKLCNFMSPTYRYTYYHWPDTAQNLATLLCFNHIFIESVLIITRFFYCSLSGKLILVALTSTENPRCCGITTYLRLGGPNMTILEFTRMNQLTIICILGLD